MALKLKYSTASQEVPLGPFLDDTDGKTAETGLTIANTDIKLWKNGATTLADKNSGGATHISGGIYYAVLDATDTDTYGPLIIFVQVAGALPVRVECEVLNTQVWDSLMGADRLQVDVREKGDSNLALTTQEKADVNAEVDSALDTAVPGSPTANSINERVKTLDDNFTSTIAGRIDVAVSTRAPEAGGNVAAILADTNELQTDWHNGGRLDLIIDAVNAKTTNLPADPAAESTIQAAIAALNDIAAADVLAEAVDGAVTLGEALAIILAVSAGKSDGGGTNTIHFRNTGDSKNRVTATVDADGNRTAMVLDGS